MSENKQPKTTRVQRIVAWVLTLVFIPTIFAFGVLSLADDPADLAKSLRWGRMSKYLTNKDTPGQFEMLKARIQSLEAGLGSHTPMKDELGWLNASFQYGIGKKLIMQGSEELLTLEGGQIYDLSTEETLAPEAEEVRAFYEQLNGEVPFLFAYVNPQFYEGSIEMDEGYATLDTGDRLADEVLGIMQDAGVPTLDSRTFFADCGYTDDELMLRTDMHWTTLAGLIAAQHYADAISEITGVPLHTDKLSVEQFETETYENFFLGEFGQQVGAHNSGYDDITLYWPKYETDMERFTVNRDGVEESASGSFRDSIIHWDAFDMEEDGTNVRGYMAYGLVERIEEIRNNGDCADLTVLVFRDSYTAPVGCFLSLLVDELVMVDMRTVKVNAIDLVEQYNPDIVIFSHSRQMYEDHAYKLQRDAA